LARTSTKRFGNILPPDAERGLEKHPSIGVNAYGERKRLKTLFRLLGPPTIFHPHLFREMRRTLNHQPQTEPASANEVLP
jgi:hypothetical protein